MPPAKFLADKLFSLNSAFCRLYDKGIFSHTAASVRRTFMTLSTRVIGIFFFTFGIYAFLIALLISLFADKTADTATLYGGVILAVSSIPLFFSKGNVSTMLTESSIGAVICNQLNIREKTLDTATFSGHSSIAFVLGVIFGAATAVFPLTYLLCAIALLLIFSVILSSPETGITFMTVLLFITDLKLQYALICVTAVSYIFKLIRRKRTLSLKKTDIVLMIFFFSSLFGVFVSHGEGIDLSALKFSLLLVAYILCICLIRDRAKLLKLIYAAIMTGGAISSLFILARALEALLPAGIFAQPEFLYETVSSFPAFQGSFASLAFSTLIPVCAAFIVKPHSEGYRFTSCVCLASMLGYLLICEELAFALVSAVATAIFLFVTGSRWVYLAMSAVLCSGVILVFAGSFGTRLYNYIVSHISEAFNQAMDLAYISQNAFAADYAISGLGFNGYGEAGSSFYFSLISQLGVSGFVILCVFLLCILAESAVLIIKTYRATGCEEAISRFPSIGTPREARACALSLSCSVLVCIICATFCNYFANPTHYLLFFMLCGFCAAYARSAKKEIGTAEGARDFGQSRDRCQTKL